MYDPAKGYPRTAPFLLYADARVATAWITEVLGFAEAVRFTMPDGTVGHVELERDGAIIMLGVKDGRFGTTSSITFVFVDDVDEACDRAVAHGGQLVAAPEEHPWGLRQAVVADPEGQRWELSQHVRDVEPSEWGAEQFRPLPG